MAASLEALPAPLAAQCRHQLRVDRARGGRIIPAVFVVGLAVSVLGLVPTVVWFRQDGSPWLRLGLFAVFTVFFGWPLAARLAGPRWLAPRMVPYFARPLGEHGGPGSVAFRRGRDLVRESAALERLAGTLGVPPLSAFGFADDYYEQPVRWHSAATGLATVAVLRAGLEDAPAPVAPGAAGDLDALAAALRIAADLGVEFSLVLRLHGKDGLQALSYEPRQGSFW